MRNGRQFIAQVGRRFFVLASAPIAGVLGASALFVGTLTMWLLGFVIIPVGIVSAMIRCRQRGEKWSEDPVLPRWASWWDDSEDLDIRGRPQGTFVWNFGLSWSMATFVHLQFYNPLANLRVRVMDVHSKATGRD